MFAYAAAQVKKCMDISKELGAENYVFWGGREGYQTLLNTDLKGELDHFARFLQLAVVRTAVKPASLRGVAQSRVC